MVILQLCTSFLPSLLLLDYDWQGIRIKDMHKIRLLCKVRISWSNGWSSLHTTDRKLDKFCNLSVVCVVCMHAFLLFLLFIPINNLLDSIKLLLFQVWDDMIIDSALKTFYGSDLGIMIKAIQNNITVCFLSANNFECNS